MSDLSYCAEMVRRHDPDRFLSGMYMPPDVRPDLWVLYALNYEVARTREVVTDTQLGLIRLQWWRETAGAVCAGQCVASGGPVAAALADVVTRHNLPCADFDRLIYAREFDVEDRLPATLEGMVEYARLTSAPLMDLALRVTGAADGAARAEDIATGYALTGLLRAVPAHLAQRRCYLPADRVGDVEDLYAGRGLDRLPAVVADVAARARSLLLPAEKNMPRILRVQRALALIYLAQIARAGHDVFSPRLSVPPFLRELRLWWALRG